MTTDEKIDILLQQVNEFKQEVNEFKQELNEFKQEVNELKQEVNELKQEVNELKLEVKHNSIITENIINKCIQTMGEGIQLNAERFERLDIDSVRLKAEQALLLVKLVNEKVDRMSA